MSKNNCIFKPTRCKKCDNLTLKSEKHLCSDFPTVSKSRRLFLEIGLAFNEIRATSLTPSEICHYLNQKFQCQKYTSYEIRWHMDQKPNIFAVDLSKQYKKYIIGKFKDGELQKIKDNIGVFEKEIFCIYYKSLELLLILDYGKTKTLLAFGDQFKEKCANILSEDLSEMIEYDDKDLSDILTNKKINELIVKMKQNNIFENKHKDHFKNWNEFYDKHTLENVEKLSLNAENKPEVKNAKDIAMVLYVANNDLMQGIANPGEFALVISKIILKLKSTMN